MSAEMVLDCGPQAYGLLPRAISCLTLDAAELEQLKEQVLPTATTFLADPDNAGLSHVSYSRKAHSPAGKPVVVESDPTVRGGFAPLLRDGRIVTAGLAAPVETTNVVTLVATRGEGGKAVIQTAYPGEPLDRLGQDGYALAFDPASDEVRSIATAFGTLFAARIDALHQAMRAAGLSAPDLQMEPVHFIEATEKAFKFSLTDIATGKDVNVEIIRNGSIFLGGRRYDATMARLALSDAEIARTGIFHIDVDHTEHSAEITFMTFDTKGARIRVHPSNPLDPVFEGKIPSSALDILKSRAEGATLAGLCRQGIKRIEASGQLGGFLKKKLSASCRQAHDDLDLLQAYCGKDATSAAEAKAWKDSPDAMSKIVDVLLRWLPANGLCQGASQVSLLANIGVSKFLASQL